ncbi:hypothetical protein [Phenylobacterium aquaticum]|uniref:hypothetical protein n=1 Tax=Phenylobacterium aquaticum TaxID=1763816 RepID=UPI0026E9F99C|nr:hypothetical protein [Phenylobacterium aquaticum]
MPKTARQAIISLRKEIEAARAEGVNLEAFVVRLTPRDDSALKRDPEIPVTDISFANGEMRFLGVRVLKGAVSCLEPSPAE